MEVICCFSIPVVADPSQNRGVSFVAWRQPCCKERTSLQCCLKIGRREHVLHQLWQHYYKRETIFCSWTPGIVLVVGIISVHLLGLYPHFSCRYPFPLWTVRSLLLKTQLQEEMTPMLALVWIMVLLHLRVGLSLYAIPKFETGITRIPGPLPPRRWTPMGAALFTGSQAPRFPTWLKTSGASRYPHSDWLHHWW